jgi:hypothetical protein
MFVNVSFEPFAFELPSSGVFGYPMHINRDHCLHKGLVPSFFFSVVPS